MLYVWLFSIRRQKYPTLQYHIGTRKILKLSYFLSNIVLINIILTGFHFKIQFKDLLFNTCLLSWIDIRLANQWWSVVSSIPTGGNFIFLRHLFVIVQKCQKYQICDIYENLRCAQRNNFGIRMPNCETSIRILRNHRSIWCSCWVYEPEKTNTLS